MSKKDEGRPSKMAKEVFCMDCAFYINNGYDIPHCGNEEYCHDHDKFKPQKGVEYEYVDHPEHYQMNDKTYEPYKVINAWDLDFNLGSVLKYIARAGKKPGEDVIRDLNKCKEYIDFEIEKLTIEKDI